MESGIWRADLSSKSSGLCDLIAVQRRSRRRAHPHSSRHQARLQGVSSMHAWPCCMLCQPAQTSKGVAMLWQPHSLSLKNAHATGVWLLQHLSSHGCLIS